MSYANARDIFPDEILEVIQKYVDGEYIYIPRKEENKIAWGELTKSKEDLKARNDKIYRDYLEGISVQLLSKKYYLSPKTIQKIISKKRKYENTQSSI
jgi:Mor family transcriptional regulator